MPTENPVIKFSPFEALFIGEKNKIVKRKPMKNTIFVTRLCHTRRKFDLRELFDVKECNGAGKNEEAVFKKPERVTEFLKNKIQTNCTNNGSKVKLKSKSEVYCYDYENRNVVFKSNASVKTRPRTKNINSHNVRFKPEFKFKETLEERIVHKIQRRKKRLSNNIINNRIKNKRKRKINRHSLRGKHGKFICKADYEKMISEKVNNLDTTKHFANYIKHICVKKNADVIKNVKKTNNVIQYPYNVNVVSPKKRIALDSEGSDTILSDISKQYYEDLFAKDLEFPRLPVNFEITDFENDRSLIDVICEYHPQNMELATRENIDETLVNMDIIRKRKGLKMYERKKPKTKGGNEIVEFFNNSMKENKCIHESVNVNNLGNVNENNAGLKGRRNDMNYLIDERPTKDNQLIKNNAFGSLFYTAASGSETFLCNNIKPVLLNSQFGRLPDIS